MLDDINFICLVTFIRIFIVQYKRQFNKDGGRENYV